MKLNLKAILCPLVCALLAGCASKPAEPTSTSAANPWESYNPQIMLGQTASARMTNAGNGQRLVHATINGHPGLFAIDTGADFTLITPKFARELGIYDAAPTGWLQSGDARRQKVRFAKITAFGLGGMDFLSFYAPVVDISHINRAMRADLSGVLGNNLLRKATCRMDWKQNLLVLDTEATARPADAFPVTVRDNRIFVTAQVNNQPAEFALDTGAYRSLVAENDLARFRISNSKVSKIRLMQVDIADTRQVERTEITVDSFKLGPIERTNYALATWTDSVIGMDLLEPWVVTFNMNEGWMSLSPVAQ